MNIFRMLGLRTGQTKKSLYDELIQFRWETSPLCFDALTEARNRIMRKLTTDSLRQTGQISSWEKGWGEIFDQYKRTRDLNDLVPQYLHRREPMRVGGRLVECRSPWFERDWCRALMSWVDDYFFQSCARVYEYGCGTGWNLVHLAQRTDRVYVGLDWSKGAVDLINMVGRDYFSGGGSTLSANRIDFFNLPDGKEYEPDTGVLTFGALEQTGGNGVFKQVIDHILRKKPSIVVHIEPIVEWYDETDWLDWTAIQYLKKRNYWSGFPAHMRALEREGKIEQITRFRSSVGSLYMEGYMVFVWRPV